MLPYSHLSIPHCNAYETTTSPAHHHWPTLPHSVDDFRVNTTFDKSPSRQVAVESRRASKRKEHPGDENTPPKFKKRNRQTGHSQCTGPTLPSLPTASTSGLAPEISLSTPAPSTSAGRRCRYENCSAVLHFPAEVKDHLKTAHGLRDRRNAVPGGPRYDCKWEGCENNKGSGYVNSLLRHVEEHMVCYRCSIQQCSDLAVDKQPRYSRDHQFYDHCRNVHNVQKATIKSLDFLGWHELH